MQTRRNKKVRQGRVVSAKADKTRIALIERTTQHSLYKRKVKISARFMFHDEENKASLGDVVKIVECKPISKNKRWRLLEVVKNAEEI